MAPPDARDARIGTTLRERYRIDALIGEGGCGVVYRATHLGLHAPVAVKFLHEGPQQSPVHRERLRREALALAQLRHPGIVTIFDYDEVEDRGAGDALAIGGAPFLVMELLSGRTLAELRGQPLPAERCVALVAQVLAALEVAHAAGIVHRDIKPENVMLVPGDGAEERVKVVDFGLVQLAEVPGQPSLRPTGEGVPVPGEPGRAGRLTTENVINGTPEYMAPEQCSFAPVGPAADVYAAGVLLYELLAGDTPFSLSDASAGGVTSRGPRGAISMHVLVQHLYVQPPPISSRGLRRAPPPGLEALVNWALAKKPADRPTAAQLRKALLQALAGGDEAARLFEEGEGRFAAAQRKEKLPLMVAPPATSRPTAERVAGAPRPQVALWGFADPRAAELRIALGVNGIDAELWPLATLGRPAGHGPVQALLLPGDAAASARTQGIRADAALGRLPIMVIDLGSAEDTAPLIRAGASDAALQGTADEVICKKAWRMIRRGR